MKPPTFGLWPPIADALHVYRRRILAEPEAHYEHIWRLLQLNESIIVCLGALLATRLKSLWDEDKEKSSLLNDICSRITGVPYSLDKSNSNTFQGCLEQGSIMPWIGFFNYFKNISKINLSCQFCEEIHQYISTTLKTPLSFLDSWKIITSVSLFNREPLNFLDRFEAINKLRNKIAHLPLPTAILPGLHRGLRKEVLSSICPSYRNKEDDHVRDFAETEFATPFVGRIIFGNVFITGSDNIGEIPVDDIILKKVQQKKNQIFVQPKFSENTEGLVWPVTPFFTINNELKVLLLFKVDDLQEENPDGEYHRFAAELAPLQRYPIAKEDIEPWIPKYSINTNGFPNRNIEYYDDDDKEFNIENKTGEVISEEIDAENKIQLESLNSDFSQKTSEELRNIAEKAFWTRDYPLAMKAFDELEKKHDTRYYNDVAKSKHGASLWRMVEQSVNQEQKKQGLDKAIRLLSAAALHRDPEYKARALYEKSKAMWHRWLIKEDLSDTKDLEESVESARQATQYSYEQAYINWLEKISIEKEDRMQLN